MDSNSILKHLRSEGPLFGTIPKPHKPFICGLESEYGVADHCSIRISPNSKDLPSFLNNGGLVYIDGEHLEWATPEVSNPASAVLYYEAGKVYCQNGGFVPKLFCHNNDCHGNTFGAHESYFTKAPRNQWCRLVPFLIARTIMCGNGWINEKGAFEISQRAKFITCASSLETKDKRGIINQREESLAEVQGYDRLHIICGDANMSEVATFLKVGTMCLLIEMLEQGTLPNISYDLDKSSYDIRSVSGRTSEWYLKGLKRNSRGAVNLLNRYYERAHALFSKRDEITEALLIIWKDTLEKLARNPYELVYRLDWVAKQNLLDEFMRAEEKCDKEWLQSQDMEYHDLNPDDGLYHLLCREGLMERLFSDELIRSAVHEPPSDTRAWARGKLVQHFKKFDPSQVELKALTWKDFMIVDRSAKGRVDTSSFKMANPFETYEEMLESISRNVR